YDVDLGPVFISDWYHRSYIDITEDLMSTNVSINRFQTRIMFYSLFARLPRFSRLVSLTATSSMARWVTTARESVDEGIARPMPALLASSPAKARSTFSVSSILAQRVSSTLALMSTS